MCFRLYLYFRTAKARPSLPRAGLRDGRISDDKLDQNKTKQGVGLAAVPDEAARNLLSEINNVLVYLYWQYINKKSQKKNKNNQVKKL